MTTYFTADVYSAENAEFMADLPELVGNGRRVNIEGTTITLTQASLDILANFGNEDDGQFDGTAIWIEGIAHAVCSDGVPLGLTIDDLAREVIADRDIDLAAANEVVRTFADQVSDDPEMWDAEREMLIGAGPQIVRESVKAEMDSTGEDLMLAELETIPAKVQELEERRDELVRSLMATSVKRARIAAAAGFKGEARLYQIRDGRR